MGLLDGMLGGGARRGGPSPIALALMGLLAYNAFKGKNLSEMMGGGGGPAGGAPRGGPGGAADAGGGFGGGGLGGALGGGGGLGGILGGLLGGGAGSILSGGLGDLLSQFQQNGQGDKAKSWVSPGQNEPVSPAELETALGPERIQWLMSQTGMNKDELLVGLSEELPAAVDKLTPDGRLPTEQEASRMIGPSSVKPN